MELQLPGQIIGAGELERSLYRDIDGHQVGQAGVKVAGVGLISHDEKDDGRKRKKIKDALIPYKTLECLGILIFINSMMIYIQPWRVQQERMISSPNNSMTED